MEGSTSVSPEIQALRDNLYSNVKGEFIAASAFEDLVLALGPYMRHMRPQIGAAGFDDGNKFALWLINEGPLSMENIEQVYTQSGDEVALYYRESRIDAISHWFGIIAVKGLGTRLINDTSNIGVGIENLKPRRVWASLLERLLSR